MRARRPHSRRIATAGLLAALALALALSAAGTAAAAGPYEPNDTRATAFGPLAGDMTYEAAIESVFSPSDEDWYFLNGRKGTVDVAYTNLQEAGNCFGPEARLYSAAGAVLGSVHPPRNVTEHITYAASAPARYFLQVTPYPVIPCEVTDSRYRFVVTGVQKKKCKKANKAKAKAKAKKQGKKKKKKKRCKKR